jgi:hypothetical protein
VELVEHPEDEGADVTVYPLMAAPPVDEGADQDSEDWLLDPLEALNP